MKAPMFPIYPSIVTSIIRNAMNITGAHADQEQANGTWGVRQLRVRLKDDPNTYRVIIAPADAPIRIGNVSADQHFLEPITQGAD